MRKIKMRKSKLSTLQRRIEQAILIYVKAVFFQATTVIAVLFAGMALEVYNRSKIIGLDFFDPELISVIWTKSIRTGIAFALIYSFSKLNYRKSIGLFVVSGKNNSSQAKSPITIEGFLTDLYVAVAAILIFVPVRPVLQDAMSTAEGYVITEAFVRYDAIHTMYILLAILVPMVAMNILLRKFNALKMFVLIVIGATSIYLNSSPNFDARIYEARAAWKVKDFNLLKTKAGDALNAADPNKQKAHAYYWLGVSSNRLGFPHEAIENQTKAIELLPNYGPAYSSLANAYSVIGDNENAFLAATECARLAYDYAWCYYSLSWYYSNIGNNEKAIENMDLAIMYDPYYEHFKEMKKSLVEQRSE